MSDKYRLCISVGLISAIIIGSTTLLWMRKNFNNEVEKDKIASEVEISNLKKENQDLIDRLAKIDKDSQGQVAGVTSEASQSEQSKSSSSNKTTEFANNPVKSNLININSANKTQLDSLPGIGPTRAQAIIDYRNTNGSFQKSEDIMKVSGIGQATYDKMKDQITVGD